MTNQALKGKKIAVVTGDEDWAQRHKEVLKGVGASVTPCNSNQFLDACCLSDKKGYYFNRRFPFDAIVTDYSGVICEIQGIENIPVVEVSSSYNMFVNEEDEKPEVVKGVLCVSERKFADSEIRRGVIEFLADGIAKNAARQVGGDVNGTKLSATAAGTVNSRG